MPRGACCDPSIKGLILTSYDDDEAMFTAILAGAAGYVLKQIEATTLLSGIRAVVQGQSLIDPSVAVRVIDRMRNGQTAGPAELASLTPQEKKILSLIAEGLTNRQIGERMFLAEKTVKNHVTNVLAKLGVERRTQAAVLASKLRQQDDPAGVGRRLVLAVLQRRLSEATASSLGEAASRLVFSSSRSSSARCTATERGASMPTRTTSPRTSRMETVTSSPMTTLSPGRRLRDQHGAQLTVPDPSGRTGRDAAAQATSGVAIARSGSSRMTWSGAPGGGVHQDGRQQVRGGAGQRVAGGDARAGRGRPRRP